MNEQNIDYKEYSELWNDTVQKIEEISKKVKNSLNDLNDLYSDILPILNDLERSTEIMSSFYAGLNILQGSEIVLKLRAIIQDEKKRHKIRFDNCNAAQFILEKLNKLRDEDLSSFPYHGLRKNTDESDKEENIHDRPFKYITYCRYDSWYICNFSEYLIIEPDEGKEFNLENNIFSLKYGARNIHGIDFFKPSQKKEKAPGSILLIDNIIPLNADHIGRIIYAKKDLLRKNIVPFNSVKECRFSPGRIRLFGRNHIILSREQIQ